MGMSKSRSHTGLFSKIRLPIAKINCIAVSRDLILCVIIASDIDREHMQRFGPGAHTHGEHGDRQHPPHTGIPIGDRVGGSKARARDASRP